MKLSHHQHILPVLFLLAGIAVLWGCSPLELPDSATDGGIVSATQSFSVSVRDGGYSPTDPSPHTRATENGYTTTFTAGDKIGVFAVKDGAIVNGVNNLCLIATTTTGSGSGSTLVWKDANGKAPLNISGATYYAYYPYQETLSGSLSPSGASAPDAATFFADVISQWTPSTAQGTYADYTAQDLMIAQGSVNGKSLSFPMQHQMSLVVIDLPRTKYTFDNEPKIPDYIIDAPDTKFNGFAPCRMSDGTYRYLVKPATDGLLSGSYTNFTSDTGATTIEWNFTATIGASNYKTYKVDGAAVTTKSHTLTVGDFYMKDGSLLAGTTESLTEEQKAACVGIVYWVGDATAKDQTLRTDHRDCTHGLVVSLGGDEENTKWIDDIAVQDWLDNNRKDVFLSVQTDTGPNDPFNNIQGYNNTKAIEVFNANNPGNIVQTVQKAVEYRTTVPAPVNSSDWYLPSAKELILLCGQEVRDFINGQLKSIGASSLSLGCSYWSSSRRNNDAFRVYFLNGSVDNDGSASYYKWRFSLTF